jgi:hypothetical protein
MYFRWSKNLWKSYLRWLLDLHLLSVEFHVLETKELSQFLSLCKRQESHAVWYCYNLFHDQTLLHCKGDVTRCMYMVVIGTLHNIVGHIGWMAFLQAFRNTQYIPQFTACAADTNTHKLPQNTLLSSLALQIKSTGVSYLQITTGPDSVWSDRPVQAVSDQTDRSLWEIVHLWRHNIWSPYKLCCKSGTAQRAQCLVQRTGVTEWTAQYSI